MESSIPQKQNYNKGQHKIAKYAPGVKVESIPITTKIRRQRENVSYLRKQHLDRQTQELRAEANAINVAEKPKTSSQWAQERIENKKLKYQKYVELPKNLSPWLNKLSGKETNEQRIFNYSIKHKCVHRNAYTSYVEHCSIKCDGTRVPVYLEPLCHCATERKTDFSIERACGFCSRKILKQKIDVTFPGEIYQCTFCKMQWYHTVGWYRTRDTDLKVFKKKEHIIPSTTKQWAVLPPVEVEKIEANKEFGAGVVEGVLSFFEKAIDGIKGIMEWVKQQVIDIAVKKMIEQTWREILRILISIFEATKKHPLMYCYHVISLMRTESTTERIFLITMMLETMGMTNILWRILDFLGMTAFVPQSLLDRYKTEKQERTARYVDNLTQAENDDLLAKGTNDSFVMPGISAKKESGHSLLEALFKFSLWLPKSSMDLVKNFNAMMSGWKNLHELVNNMLDKLPTWLTKLFTITDPRKRYGVESKTPGNPVYDMVQAYIALLKGDACASPAVYDKFVRAWKESDSYIMREYQVNDFVNRLNASFRLNAAAVMRPGTRGSKPIPFVITLYGDPGTGKSSSWPVLLSDIVGGSISNIRGMSYTRNTTSEYFDGYNPEKHKIFVYDDFGSQIDDEGMGELMSIVSNADFLPPYASLSDPTIGVKGTSFDSPIVVLCSNFRDFSHCKQIADAKALRRRLGIVINWNHKLNDKSTYAVFRSEVTGEQSPLNKASGDNYYSIPELQAMLADEYQKHMKHQWQRDDYFNKYMTGKPKTDFKTLYEKAVEARKELGIISAMTIVSFTHGMADYVDRKFGKWGDIILSGLAILAGVYTAYRFMCSVPESGEGHIAKGGNKPMFSRITARKEIGSQDEEGIIKRVTNNHVVLVDQDLRFVSGLFVCGRIFLTVKHFAKAAKKIMIHSHRATDTEVFEFEMRDARIVEFPDVDLALVECPVYVQPFTNITKYFCTEPITKAMRGYVTRRNHSELMVYGVDIKQCRTIQVFRSLLNKSYEQVCDLQYEFTHANGDCGNVLFAQQGGSLKIVGVHESGAVHDPILSFANTIHRQELEKILKQFEENYSSQLEFPYEEVVLENGVSFNKTLFVGYSDKHIVGPQETDIIPSLVHDQVRTHTTKPSLLRKIGDLDPMVKALNKYGLSTKQFPMDYAQQAAQSLTEELQSMVDGDDFEPLTLHEALNGIPGIVDSVDLTTSSGYPYSLDPKTRGAKRRVINGEPGNLTLNRQAQEHFDSWTKMMDEGIIPNDPFIATLKIEPRPIEKVDAGKTRVFCAGSLTSFLQNKMLMAKFGVFLKRIRGKSFSTIGLNRGSREWHEMIMRFREAGEYGLDGDQEEWDGRFKSHLAMLCFEIICTICKYGERERRRLKILFLHAVFPYLRVSWKFAQALLTVLIRILGCMPSGWYATLLINSMVNALIFRISWLALVSAPFNDLKYFRSYTREKYTGDDSLLSVAQPYLAEFNNIEIAKFLAIYGQKYTPASKSGELVPYQKIEDCLFLKTITGRLFDQYVPLFDMNANFSTVNWIRKCDDKHFATESNCNDALRNLFFYGRGIFELWRMKMLKVIPTMNLISFGPLETAYLGYGCIPDPYGTFGFSKSNTRDPAAFYRAVQLAREQQNLETPQKVVSVKEVGNGIPNMNKLISAINEARQKHIQYERMKKEFEERDAEVQKLLGGMDRSEVMICLEAYARTLSGPMTKSIKEHISDVRVELVLKMKQQEWDENHPKVEAKKESGLRTEQPVASQSKQPSMIEGNVSNIDDSTPKITSKMGVHLSEQQQTVVMRGTDGNAKPMSSRPDAHLNEVDWDLQKMLLRENLVGAFAWDLTTAVGTELPIVGAITAADVPSDLLENELVAAPFMRFLYWRCDRVKVRFQLVASRFHQGRALVYFVPSCLPKAQQDATIIRGPTRATQLQHGFLDPANGTVLDFTIPFVHHKGFLDLVYGDSLGQLHIQVLNQLKAATGASTSVEVKVFVSFEGSHFRVPREGGLSFKTLLARQAKSIGYKMVKEHDFDLVEAQKESGTFGKIGENLGNELDNLIDSVIPSEITGAVAGVLLDKPAVTEYPEPLVHKDAQYMSASRGIEKLERMTLEPSAQYLTTDQFGSSVDEMDMKYLIKKPVFLTTFNWASTAAVGDTLFSAFNSPAHLMTRKTLIPGTVFDPTIIGFLANMFTYWRGSIVYIFQFIGTAFHEGRMDFCNHVGQLTPPTDYRAAMSQYVNSQTIRNTNNTVEVRVPFHSDIPWKRVWTGEALSDTPTGSNYRATDYMCGTFTARVAVPLKNPNNVANNIDVNVFVCGGDDMEFHTLSMYASRYQLAFLTDRKDSEQKEKSKSDKVIDIKKKILAVKQVGDLNTDDKTDKGVVCLGVGEVYTRDVGAAHFGETYSSLREICKRYVHIDRFLAPPTAGNGFVQFTHNPQFFPGMMGIVFNSYRLFRGPMNYKMQVVAKDAGALGFAPQFTAFVTNIPFAPVAIGGIPTGAPINYDFTIQDSRMVPLVRMSDRQVAEYQIPFQSIYHSLLTSLLTDVGAGASANAVVNFRQLVGYASPAVETETADFRVEAAFGDETRLGVFMGFPQLQVRTAILWPNAGI